MVEEQRQSIHYSIVYCRSLNMMDRNHMNCDYYSYFPSIHHHDDGEIDKRERWEKLENFIRFMLLVCLTNIIGLTRIWVRILLNVEMIAIANLIVAQQFVIQFVFFDGSIWVDRPRSIVLVSPLTLCIWSN